jgi:hypothetical protein
VPEIKRLGPPGALLVEEGAPQFSGATNEDLLHYRRELLEWGWRCNEDKAAIRKWVDAKQTEATD